MTETLVDTSGNGAQGSDVRVDLASVELLALVSMRSNPATDRARALLGLPDEGLDSPVTTAGIGSLLARRMATISEGRLAPRGPVNAIASILVNADQWIEAIGTTDEASNVAAVVRSPGGTALFEPRPFNVWNVWPMPQNDTLAEIGARFVESAFTNLPEARPFSGSIRAINEDGTTRTAIVTVAQDESWTLSSGPGGDIAQPVPIQPDPTFRTLVSDLA